MKKLLATATIAGLAGFGLVACGSDAPAPRTVILEQSTIIPKPAPAAPVFDEQAYVAHLKKVAPHLFESRKDCLGTPKLNHKGKWVGFNFPEGCY
jgi:hypothetical protein